jgi:tetratricopeptide (TPR) repeat protein
MQKEMLSAICHKSKYTITKDFVNIYEAEKHKLPCWDCKNKPTCFSELKSIDRVKDEKYTVKFRKPCIDSILAMDIINMAMSGILKIPLYEIDEMEISELSKMAFELFNAIEADLADGQELGPSAYALFIRITQRDSVKPEDMSYAYYRLGHIYHLYFKEFDHAITLYSRAINLKPEIPDIIVERGNCFYMQGDYNNALNDFKRAVEIGGKQWDYLENTIEECEARLDPSS